MAVSVGGNPNRPDRSVPPSGLPSPGLLIAIVIAALVIGSAIAAALFE